MENQLGVRSGGTFCPVDRDKNYRANLVSKTNYNYISFVSTLLHELELCFRHS